MHTIRSFGVYIKRKRRESDFRIKLGVLLLAAFFVVFTGARLLLFILNYDTFSNLTFWQTVWAFVHGIRFDADTIAVFVLPAVLLMMLPVSSKKWIKFWTVAIIFELIVMGAVLISDIIYFGYVKRHMGEEILSLVNDISFIVGYALGPGLKILILIILVLFMWVWIISKFIDRKYSGPVINPLRDLIIYAAGIIIILLANYGLSSKHPPLNITNAYLSMQSSSFANLSLNGIFTSYQVIKQGNYIDENKMDINLATDITTKYLLTPAQMVEMPYQFPIMRSDNVRPLAVKPNLVVVVLESWVPEYIDEVKGTSYGVTPVFDELVRKGMYFDNFFAFELRSIHGIAAILTGVPSLPKVPKLGYGLEKDGITKLPAILKEHGYRTIFAQTSKRNSFNLYNTALEIGFQEAYGMEDMPQQFPYVKQEGYGYDYDMYHMLADKLKEQRAKKEPFFLFAFTGITHIPYLGNLDGFTKYPNDTDQNKYLNSLNYADFSIGYFLEQAKKDGWFNDTIFIFVADHTFNRKGGIKEKYHIPMLVYSPKYVRAKRVAEVGSQLDILPTIFDLLKLSEPYSAAGKSLLEMKEDNVAIFADGYTIGLISSKGAVRHTREKALEAEIYDESFSVIDAEELLLALDKTYYTLIKESRWYEEERQDEE